MRYGARQSGTTHPAPRVTLETARAHPAEEESVAALAPELAPVAVPHRGRRRSRAAAARPHARAPTCLLASTSHVPATPPRLCAADRDSPPASAWHADTLPR